MKKKHSNLYYILQEDQTAHPMPPYLLRRLRKVILAWLPAAKESGKKE